MRLFRRAVTSGSYYGGIQMLTSEGVHDEVERLVAARFPPERRSGVRALDVGAGALSRRLFGLGFTDLLAWELEPERFEPTEIPVEAVDLNGPFPEPPPGGFGLVTAVEVIEHLENPFHFLREVARLLAPDGILVLTSPNIESAASRLKFLAKGEFRWFGEDDYRAWGHIQPISAWQLDKAARRAGLQILERSYNLRDTLVVADPGARSIAAAVVGLALGALVKGQTRGDINVWILARLADSA
jgi:SAM-dependent methyltransferase